MPNNLCALNNDVRLITRFYGIITHKVGMTGASLSEPHTCVKNKNFNCTYISVYGWDVHIPYVHFSLSNISMYCYIASHSYIAMLKSQ